MENKKEKKELKELLQDPRTKGYIFFGFYFIFFLILIIVLRTGRSTSDQVVSGTTPTPTPSSSTEVTSEVRNYQYIYTVDLDSNTTIYNGKAYHNKEMFTMIKDGVVSSYYRLSDNFLRKEGDQYLVDQDPYLYSQFYELDLLEDVVEKSLSEETVSNVTTYSIDIVDIFDTYFEEIPYDGFSISEMEPDQIIVTREEERITKVEFSLNNSISYYSIYDNSGHETLGITLEFYDFNTVEDFDI